MELQIKNLVTEFSTMDGRFNAVNQVSIDVPEGGIVGIVGESGCGKSVTSLSIMRLLPKQNSRITGGEILFEGKDLLKLSEAEMREIRGNQIAMIFQEPMTALNPVFTIGFQIGEVLELHLHLQGKELQTKIVELLEKVGISDPEKTAAKFPHQLSGGMRQRVMIAMALACNPKLLIADEPTTALDVTIQAQVLELIKRLSKEYHMSVILITHDLGVIAEMTDQVVVMYAGQVVESGSAVEIFEHPCHPYTIGLLDSRLSRKKKGDPLTCIPGMVPSPLDMPCGCAFAPRCTKRTAECEKSSPALQLASENHYVRCPVYFGGRKE